MTRNVRDNALLLEVETGHVTEVFTSYGERGRAAEAVARQAANTAIIVLHRSEGGAAPDR